MGICYFWQRMRDSNPRKRSQSPVCYRYTNPLCCGQHEYYIAISKNVKYFFQILHFYFLWHIALPYQQYLQTILDYSCAIKKVRQLLLADFFAALSGLGSQITRNHSEASSFWWIASSFSSTSVGDVIKEDSTSGPT